MAGLMEGKTALVMGARNKWSIAWEIAVRFAEHGARVALTYQGDREESAVSELAAVTGAIMMPCDVTDAAQMESAFNRLADEFGALHALVHAIAFARREDISGSFSDTSREGFLDSMGISVYSLVEASRLAAPLMTEGGSIQTLTYLGSERVVPNYNLMGVAKAALEASVRYLADDLGPKGIRVNALSAGPIKTLSARGIAEFDTILRAVAAKAPLQRNVTQAEVADVALFLASDLSRSVTGETLYADSGYHIKGA